MLASVSFCTVKWQKLYFSGNTMKWWAVGLINNRRDLIRPANINMMTSSNGNNFRVTGPLCGEFTGPGDFPHKGQWRGALIFSLVCVWINGWVNSREAGDLRRYRGHYDVNVMNEWLQRASDMVRHFRVGLCCNTRRSANLTWYRWIRVLVSGEMLLC